RLPGTCRAQHRIRLICLVKGSTTIPRPCLYAALRISLRTNGIPALRIGSSDDGRECPFFETRGIAGELMSVGAAVALLSETAGSSGRIVGYHCGGRILSAIRLPVSSPGRCSCNSFGRSWFVCSTLCFRFPRRAAARAGLRTVLRYQVYGAVLLRSAFCAADSTAGLAARRVGRSWSVGFCSRAVLPPRHIGLAVSGMAAPNLATATGSRRVCTRAEDLANSVLAISAASLAAGRTREKLPAHLSI